MPPSPATSFRERLLWPLCLGLLLVACARPQAAPSRALPPPSAVDKLRGGATLAVPRPTPSVAWLSLWVAAGSRDTAPPQLASAAAWLVAERASAGARVEPHSTELSLRCDVANGGLARCVERLGLALTRSEVSESEATQLRERLRRTRLQAATDSGRAADERALRALLGGDAEGFLPLGKPEDDLLVTGRALSQFLMQRMRVDRSLLIAVGDVDDEALERAFARFRPRGAAAEDARPVAPALRTELTLADDAQASLAFALAAPDCGQAAAIAERMELMYAGASTRVARLPGFCLAHVRMPAGAEPFARLQRAVFDLRRLATELPGDTAPPREDGLDSLARELGELWVMRGIAPATLPTPWPLGVAVTLPAMPTTPKDSDPSERRLRQERAARAAVAAGEANAIGPVVGSASAEGADLTVPNGVRIHVERRHGDRWVGAALRLDQGSRDDPDTRHGRAALLATWLSNGCGFAHGRALTAHLNAIDAHVAPLVHADASGVRMVAPMQHWQPALDTLLRCAVRPALGARAIEDARVRLLATLTAHHGPLYEAFAARALVSATPGFVASWGTPRGVSSVSAAELRRLHRNAMQGSRLSVSVAVDAEPGEVARFIARRLAQLEPGQASVAAAPAGASELLIGEQLEVPALRVVVALRADGDARRALAPALLAEAFRAALGQRMGQPVWHGGDANASLSFAAVGLALTESELPSVQSVAHETLRSLAARSDGTWQSALRSAQLTRSSELSAADGWAEAALLNDAPAATLAQELTTLRRLLAATPHFVVLRPLP